jgi:hypothetical protein
MINPKLVPVVCFSPDCPVGNRFEIFDNFHPHIEHEYKTV